MIVGSKTLEYLSWGRIKEFLEGFASTELGQKKIQSLEFLPSLSVVESELRAVDELKVLLSEGRSPDLRGIRDVREMVIRAEKDGVLTPTELLAVADCVQGLDRVRTFLTSNREKLPHLSYLLAKMHDLEHVASDIATALERDGAIKDDASATLRELRLGALGIHQALRARLDDYLRSHLAEEVLQDRYCTLREDRYVVPVRAERQGMLQGIIHGVSQSGATVFVEPDFLVGLNNRLKLAQEGIRNEERRILKALSQHVGKSSAEILESLEMSSIFDTYLARARMAEAIGACRPKVAKGRELRLLNARFPLMLIQSHHKAKPTPDHQASAPVSDGRQPGSSRVRPTADFAHDEPQHAHPEVVPNDFVVGGEYSLLVLSGPNGSGKSVALKTCGLCVLMTHCGILPPVSPDSIVPFFQGVHAVPGHLEEIEEQLSTFSGHLRELNRTLRSVGPGHLVLIDEIAVGTEPEQGAALAVGYLLAFADTGALGLVATHHERLKQLAMVDSRFRNASTGMDWERLVPTYRLAIGNPGSSRTLEMARRFGVPQRVIAAAMDTLKGRNVSLLEDAIRRLEEREKELEEAAARQKELALAAEQMKRRRELALNALSQQAKRIIAAKVAQGLKDVNAALARVSEAIGKLQAGGGEEEVPALRRMLEETRAKLMAKERELKEEELAPYIGQTHERVQVGGIVTVRRFRREATVLDISHKHGSATLQMGSMRITLPLRELIPITKSQDEVGPFFTRRHGSGQAVSGRTERSSLPGGIPGTTPPWCPSDSLSRTVGPAQDLPGERNRVDMRGMTVDEALKLLERTLDWGILCSKGPTVLVHGHGTGKLKQAIREFLANTVYPVTFRPGRREEGGDGVTVVMFG